MGASSAHIPRWTTGLLAMGLSLHLLWISGSGGGEALILFASLFFLVAVATDTLCNKIPNLLTLSLVLTALAYHSYQNGLSGLTFSALGLLTGLVLLILPYILGGMGAGDVKALAALGALLGTSSILQVFLYMALIGGAVALLQFIFNSRLRRRLWNGLLALKIFMLTRDPASFGGAPAASGVRIPYLPVIALGYYSFLHWGGIL